MFRTEGPCSGKSQRYSMVTSESCCALPWGVWLSSPARLPAGLLAPSSVGTGVDGAARPGRPALGSRPGLSAAATPPAPAPPHTSGFRREQGPLGEPRLPTAAHQDGCSKKLQAVNKGSWESQASLQLHTRMAAGNREWDQAYLSSRQVLCTAADDDLFLSVQFSAVICDASCSRVLVISLWSKSIQACMTTRSVKALCNS